MKRIFALLTILMLTLCLTTTAFASNGTRTGEVIGGGSVDTEIGADASRRHGSGTGSGGVDLSNPNATQDYINNELFGGNGVITPNVSTDTIVGKLESKGNDIVYILQTVGKYGTAVPDWNYRQQEAVGRRYYRSGHFRRGLCWNRLWTGNRQLDCGLGRFLMKERGR